MEDFFLVVVGGGGGWGVRGGEGYSLELLVLVCCLVPNDPFSDMASKIHTLHLQTPCPVFTHWTVIYLVDIAFATLFKAVL